MSMIHKSGWMLGKLVRISDPNSYMFRSPYDGTIALVVETPKVETAQSTVRVMYHDGRFGTWYQSDLQVVGEEAV